MNTNASQRSMEQAPGNRLSSETSPYLQQHAQNPVHWEPWDDAALARARSEDKPIFLSVGYSACHWCHVMEHESFERQDIADFLNAHYVSIKVDREERPDLDDIYMTSVQMLTGSGGWPMTVFLTPDLKPFFGGTYFPPEDRYGRVGFLTLIERLHTMWTTKRAELEKGAAEITDALSAHVAQRVESGQLPPETILRQGGAALTKTFDAEWGGFGGAPKFPPSSALMLLLRLHLAQPDGPSWTMAEHTLNRMAAGGMYDHVGGGFHRYSVDEQWLVPHFEKMLYDNAQLAIAYTEAAHVSGHADYRRIVSEIFTYVERDMTHPDGGFFSSEDADSEGEEGLFYVWKREELDHLLGAEETALASEWWGVSAQGNFEGSNILHAPEPATAFAQKHGIAHEEFFERIETWRKTLLAARAQRVRPARDEKIIAAWNGMMISALARAGQAFDFTRYTETAARAASFVLDQMVQDDRLHRTWRDGHVRHTGFLDDHAWMAQALLDLYEATFDRAWLDAAVQMVDQMKALFWDETTHAFRYTSPVHHPDVLIRTSPTYDGAEPSGNSVAAWALARLAKLLGRSDDLEKADALFGSLRGHMERMPHGVYHLLCAFDFHAMATPEIVLMGNPDAPDTRALILAARGAPVLNRVLCAVPESEANAFSPLTQGKTCVEGRASAYVCRNFTCQAPVTDPVALAETISSMTS